MLKHFAVIATEIILVAALGFFTNLAAAELRINGARAWIALILLLLLLIPTTWFRVRTDAGDDLPRWRLRVPETVTLSISLRSMRRDLRWLIALIVNGALFGWLVAYASVFAVRMVPGLDYSVESAYRIVTSVLSSPYAFSFEVIGVFSIGFAAMYVWKRLSSLAGILFCVVTSLAFSATHLSLLPFQHVGWTVLGNLISSLLITAVLVICYPALRILLDLTVGFWRGREAPK